MFVEFYESVIYYHYFILSEINVEKFKNTLVRALKRGVNYIDTAPYYGQGQSEEILGKVSMSYIYNGCLLIKRNKKILRFWKGYQEKLIT